MRATLVCLAVGAILIAACSKPAANTTIAANTPAAVPPAVAAATPAPAASGAPVSGVFTADGQQANLTQVTAHSDDPFDGQPVTAIVMTAKDQGGDAKAATSALFGNYGEAIVVRITPDGKVVGADVIHPGLKSPNGSVSLSGVLTIEDYKNAGGQLSGHLTTGGDNDVFDHKLNVDLTFHTKAP
ncbi:MAG TPA: hypothetical protein VGI95_15800 [Caulobacteraceae bacterium]|jgi:hypothetical protein